MITNKFYIALFILLNTALLLTGCKFENKNAERTIFSEDGLFSVTLPKGWKQITDYSLNDIAEIQAMKIFGDRYFIASMENKNDLEYNFDEWTELVIDIYLSASEKASISEGKDVLIGGQPAKQYEISATVDKVKIKILATYINGENHFAQILAWTLASKYKSSFDDLNAITNSIKGL